MSSVEVEQPVSNNAKAMSEKTSFKRFLFIICSLTISYCYIIAFLSAISKSFLFSAKLRPKYGFRTITMISFG